MTTTFEAKNIESPRLISEMLLQHVLGGERIDLYADINRGATDQELEKLRLNVKRTLEHEPVQYIVGKAWFNGLEFLVNSSTLIPRTCTEVIVEECIHFCANNSFDSAPTIADIGTGTGCIAVSIAKNTSACEIVATDISEDALGLAKENAQIHEVASDISFALGDGLSAIEGRDPFDVICSNPPYVPTDEMEQLQQNVKDWEPELALQGGKNGLFLVQPLLERAHLFLKGDGMILIEIASSTKEHVLEIAQANSALRDFSILKDRYGDNRFLKAFRA
jgi:release factor glutamine methyltransferase